MNFTDSPFERMMKQIPRPGRACEKNGQESASPRKPKKSSEAYRDIIITSAHGNPAKSQTLRGEEEQRSGANFGPNWPEVAERSL